MKLQKISNVNSFNGLNVKHVGVDHFKKFIEPSIEHLRLIADSCVISIKDTGIPVEKIGNAIIEEPAINVTIKPLLSERMGFFFKHLFSGKPNRISTTIPISTLEKQKSENLLARVVEKSEQDLYETSWLDLLY